MDAEWGTLPGADVILRASGGKELHAHKLVLSLASPVFENMFSIPQPATESSQLPIIDVNDSPETLEQFLRVIYPVPNPPIHNVELLASLLRLADKYDVKAIFSAHKIYFPTISAGLLPVHEYAILCVSGREKEAEAAARRVPFASLTSLDSSTLLDLMTTVQYHRLASFMVTRDQRMRQILNRRREGITGYCSGHANPTHRLYSSIIAATLQAAFEADPCIQVTKALCLVLDAPIKPSPCGAECMYNIAGLRRYAEGLLQELVKMAECLPWGG